MSDDEVRAIANSPQLFRVQGGAGTLVGEVWEPTGEPLCDILMLHGGAQTRFTWNKAADKLVEQGYRVTTYDARGHGDSDWDPNGKYDIFEMESDLQRVLDQRFADKRPIIVGASMGGLAAQVALGSGKDSARALVLVDITPRIEAEGISKIASFLMSGMKGFSSLEEVADAVQAYQPHRDRPRNLEGLKKNVRLKDDGRWYWHWDPRFALNAQGDAAGKGTEIFTELARGISVPVLLIKGQHSDIVSDQGVRELVELIPHAYTHEVAGAGHMVAGDDNAVFLQQLDWFLDEVILADKQS